VKSVKAANEVMELLASGSWLLATFILKKLLAVRHSSTTDLCTEARAPAGGAGSTDRLVAGIVAAAGWALGGGLGGRSVAIEGHEQAPAGLREALVEAGATVADVWGVADKPWLIWGADVDAILAGSRPGVLTHQGTASVTASAIVPWGPIPVTTKAFIQLQRSGPVVVPDFVSAAGQWLDENDDVSTRIVAVLDEAAADEDGVFLGACYRAEAFIETWQSHKPFGRPLAG
jgi:hypothetical protein